MDFAAFWFDVLQDSTTALLAFSGALGDAVAVRLFSAKHPDKLRARSLMWLSTNLTYRVRLRILAALFVVSIMWTAYDKWAIEVARADTAEQARVRQQFARFPIGYPGPEFYYDFESSGWVTLETPAVPYDWSTVPPDADVFATIRVRFSSSRRSTCRAVRVRVRDLASDAVAGESERIPYISDFDPETVRIRLDRRTMPTSYALEVESETTECAVNVQGEIGAEYR